MNIREEFRIDKYCETVLCDVLCELGIPFTWRLRDRYFPKIHALFCERADATNSLTEEQDQEIYRLTRAMLEQR